MTTKPLSWPAHPIAQSPAQPQTPPELPSELFRWRDPARIAHFLKQFAEASRRRRATPFRSAMSMLTCHMNRAGETLSDDQRRILERAKDELRTAFGRPPNA